MYEKTYTKGGGMTAYWRGKSLF